MQRKFARSAAFVLVVGLVSAPVPALAMEPEILQVQPQARVAGGGAHTVVLAPDGRVVATGANEQGQLGDGTTTDRVVSVRVQNLTDVIAVDAGTLHSLALDASGRVWAWGDNDIAQLGNGTTTDSPAPVQVDPTNLTDVVAISAGHAHNLAVNSDGTVWAWGNNRVGELGTGRSFDESPVPVQVDDSELTGVVAVSAGQTHNLAIDATGAVWAWGTNSFGQIGDGSDQNARRVPVRVDDTELTGAVAVAAGGLFEPSHSLAIDAGGAVWAWGANFNGQLGNGGAADRSPVPVRVDDTQLTGAVAVAAGGWHSLAIDASGNAWAWGDNSRGQLGDGSTTERLAPVGVIMTDMDHADALGAGTFHSLTVGDLPNDTWAPWAWGAGDRGQLGSARTQDFSEPVPVTPPFAT